MPKDGTGSDAAAVIAAHTEHLRGEPVKHRQVSAGHADRAIPCVLDATVADLREQLRDGSLGPGRMDSGACPAKRPDAADDEAASLVEANGAQHRTSVGDPLLFRQHGGQDAIHQRLRRDVEIRQLYDLTPDLGPWTAGVSIGGYNDPFGPHRAVYCAYPPAGARSLDRKHRTVGIYLSTR